MKILYRAYFHQKNFHKKVGQKFIRVRIRIRTFSKVGSGSGQKSSGSATLVQTKDLHLTYRTTASTNNRSSEYRDSGNWLNPDPSPNK
jgi:hypothetical protein